MTAKKLHGGRGADLTLRDSAEKQEKEAVKAGLALFRNYAAHHPRRRCRRAFAALAAKAERRLADLEAAESTDGA